MAAQSIAYHAHGTAAADGDKFCRYPWLACHEINSAMHCSLRLAPTMMNHLTSYALVSLSHMYKTGIIGASLSEPHKVQSFIISAPRREGIEIHVHTRERICTCEK